MRDHDRYCAWDCLLTEITKDGVRYIDREKALFHESYLRVSLDENTELLDGKKFKHALLILGHEKWAPERSEYFRQQSFFSDNPDMARNADQFYNCAENAQFELMEYMREECDKGNLSESDKELKSYLLAMQTPSIFRSIRIKFFKEDGGEISSYYSTVMLFSSGEVAYAKMDGFVRPAGFHESLNASLLGENVDIVTKFAEGLAPFTDYLPRRYDKACGAIRRRGADGSDLQRKWEDFIDPLLELFIKSERELLSGTKLEKDPISGGAIKPWCGSNGTLSYDDMDWNKATEMVQDHARTTISFADKERVKDIRIKSESDKGNSR